MIPLVRDGGLYASRKWTPLVMDGGYTQGGGGEPEPAWEYKYVAGMSPLLLAAALGKPLKSLTQYGLCSQASTPTPSTPIDILCNNGALRMVDDELPAGYKRLTGIRFDGDIHYETGEALMGDDDVTMTLDNTASQGQNVFGSYNGTSSGTKNFSLFIYGNGASTGSYFRYGEQLLRPKFGSGERTITFGKSGTDGFMTDASATPDTFTTPANAYIGMLPNSTSPAYTGDIKGNIVVGTRLKWIPCERESDNAIGYYEAVKGNFIEPSGTGTPTSLGYDGSHYQFAVVGTPEVLSVGGKNLNGGTIENKGYTSTGGESTSTTFAGTLWKIPCKEGDKFTASWGGFPDGVSGVFINTWKTDGTWNARQAISASTSLTYTIGAGVGIVNFTLYKTGGITIGENAWMQVEYGTTPTDYEPYITPQTASVPDLYAVGDYLDEVEVVSGAVKRKVGIKVFDGTENINTSNACFTIPISDRVTSKTALLCSHFPYSSKTSSQTDDETVISFSSTNVGFRYDACADKTAFAAWLKAQYAAGTPVIVIYPLAEETTESVTPQALSTNEGDNVVSVTAEVSPIQLSAEYAILSEAG